MIGYLDTNNTVTNIIVVWILVLGGGYCVFVLQLYVYVP
jgi:uncharacterized membrane-anchored protein